MLAKLQITYIVCILHINISRINGYFAKQITAIINEPTTRLALQMRHCSYSKVYIISLQIIVIFASKHRGKLD